MGGACGSGDLQWYRVHTLPPEPSLLFFPPSLSLTIKEHMVQINSNQQREEREEGKREGGQGHRSERGEETRRGNFRDCCEV